MKGMTVGDVLAISGISLIAAGFGAIGWAIRLVATGVDETIGFVERRRN